LNFADLQKLIVPLASMVGGFATIFGFFFWWHKRVIGKLEAEADNLRAERMVAIQEKQAADARAELAVTAKNAAVERKDDILRKAQDLKIRYDTSEKRLKDMTEDRDRRVAELTAIGGAAEQRFNESKLSHEVALADKQAIAVSLLASNAEIVAEKETLAAKLKDARADLAEERKRIRETLKQHGKIWLAKVPKDAPRFRPLKDRKTVIIAVLNIKGGVGKTTITANLAGLLGSQGKKVLMIDLDHQRSLSRMLLPGKYLTNLVHSKKSIQTFFTSEAKGGPQLLSNSVSVDGMPNCELIVNHDPQEGEGVDDEVGGLEELEMQMQLSWLLNTESTGDIRFYLRESLHSDGVANSFDYVLLDCPPRMSTACVNAIAAADFVLIPVQGEAVAARSVEHVVNRLRELRSGGPCANLRVLGIIGNLFHPVADMESAPEVFRLREMAANLSHFEIWPEPVQTFATVLPRMRQYLDASNELGQGGKLKLAASHFPAVRTLFEKLAKEIEDRIHDHRNAE